MNTKDIVVLLLELLFAVVVAGLLCYAHVDLGMSYDQISNTLRNWLDQSGTYVSIIALQVLVAVAFIIGHKIWQHKTGKAD